MQRIDHLAVMMEEAMQPRSREGGGSRRRRAKWFVVLVVVLVMMASVPWPGLGARLS